MATLAEVLRQAGYVTPQGQVTGPRTDLAQKLKSYVMNIPQNAAQNLANQRADIDAALTMGQGGIQIGDREAFARQMAEVPNLMGAIAYHGTPHTIKGKFDISKVGTGEGAQAYGHGMYFAESPAVAKTYIKAGDEGFKANAAEYAIQQYGGIDQAIQKLTEKLKNPDEYKWVKENTQTVLDGLNKLKKGEQIGNLYKVDIPDEYIPNMLDWDKPLSEQPKVVQNAFKSILNKEVSPQGLDIGGAKILDNRNRQTDPTQSKPWVMQSGDKYFGLDQKDVDQLISNETAKGLYGRLAADLGSQQAASEFLLNQGVKGIRYLDQASRGKSGTSNFVVFEPSEVKILEQNSKPMTRKEIIEQELEKVAK